MTGGTISSPSAAITGVSASSCQDRAARLLRRQKSKDAARTRIKPAVAASQGQRLASAIAGGAAVTASVAGAAGRDAGEVGVFASAIAPASGVSPASPVSVAAGDDGALPVGLGVARAAAGEVGLGGDTLGVAVGVAAGGCAARSVGRGVGRTVGTPRGVMKIPSSTSIGPCGILVGVGVGEGGGSWKSRTDPGDAITGPASVRLASAEARIGKEIERVINSYRASQRAR